MAQATFQGSIKGAHTSDPKEWAALAKQYGFSDAVLRGTAQSEGASIQARARRFSGLIAEEKVWLDRPVRLTLSAEYARAISVPVEHTPEGYPCTPVLGRVWALAPSNVLKGGPAVWIYLSDSALDWLYDAGIDPAWTSRVHGGFMFAAVAPPKCLAQRLIRGGE